VRITAVLLAIACLSCADSASTPRPIAFRETALHAVGEHPLAVVITDFDLDGDSDALVPGFLTPDLTILRNDAGSLVALPQIQLAGGVIFATSADFDEVGLDDLALSMSSLGIVQLVHIDPTGGIQVISGSPVPQAGPVAVGELDGDGHLDVVASRYEGGMAFVLRGDGTGRLSQAEIFAVPQIASSGCMEDLNGDGIDEIILTGADPGEVWLRADGEIVRASTGGTWPMGVIASQIDGDDELELVGAVNQGEKLFIADLHDDALSMRELPFVGQPAGLAAGDLDGDGHVDLVVTAKGADRVDVLRGDGAGNFEYVLSLATGWGPTPVALADLDLDGCLDLLVVNSFSNDVSQFMCDQPPKNDASGTAMTWADRGITVRPR
jgi:hypothetical protein